MKVEDSGLGSEAIFGSKDYAAILTLRDDNVRAPDWSKMNIACVGGACIAYFKHCESDEAKIR